MKKETKEKVLSASKTLLMIVGALGFVTIAAVAGNAVQLLKYTPLIKRSKLKIFEINQAVKRMLDRGWLEIAEDKHYKFLRITDKGKRLLLKYQLDSLAQDKPQKWDKKYRVVIFDIAEHKRITRNHLLVC